MVNDSFLGRGWSFPPTFVRNSSKPTNKRPVSRCSGFTIMVENEEDICQSLAILFNTTLGERVMQPRYGCDLNNQVFEPMNAAVLTFIEDLLRTAIIYHEPRIETDHIILTPEHFEGRLTISIDYRIRETNSRFNFVYPYYFAESGQQV